MRPLWKGSISFGLVNIPVGLYSATSRSSTIDLDLLRDSDHSRIQYRKVAAEDGQEVPKENIVKGFEYERDKYVVLAPSDFERVRIKSNQTVDIREFINAGDVEPRFYDTPYFVAPEKGGAKAYMLLRMALEKSGLAGVAKVVIRPPREHLALVRPLGNVILVHTLHFKDELREPSELKIQDAQVGEKELDMALSLVKTMSGKWDAAKYHDEYREHLMEVIEEKIGVDERELPAPKGRKQAPAGKVIDLVSLLQASIGQTDKKRKPKAASARRQAHKKAA
jgi:DNA end-binding protein Ku